MARGEHEAEDEITALWELPDAAPVRSRPPALYARHPGDARIAYEHAGAHDSAGDEEAAVPLYEEALAAGLREPHRHRAQLQLASSLRNVGRLDEAVAVIDDVAARHPDSLGVAAFRALVHHDAGGPARALGDLLAAVAVDEHRPRRRPLPQGAHGLRRRACATEPSRLRAVTSGGSHPGRGRGANRSSISSTRADVAAPPAR